MKKVVPTRAEIAATLDSKALEYIVAAEALEALDGPYDTQFAAALRRSAAKYKERAERMRNERR